jgi:spore maturation protein A
MLMISFLSALVTHRIPELALAVTDSAALAFKIAFSLVGIMAFWLGLMEIADRAGLIASFARMLRPLLDRLFPGISGDEQTMNAIVLNLSTNVFGLGNAATPFGIKAMEYLEKRNPKPGIASDAMCMFLTLNTSSVQLIPVTGMAFLASGGALMPHDIILPTIMATTCSTTFGVIVARWLQTWPIFALPKEEE